MIVIIDYGAGNLGSIYNMLKKLSVEAKISSDKNDVLQADKLILPGVGSFDFGMSKLEELDLINPLNQRVIEAKIPILGVCLGVQLFCKKSEEGSKPGLGWFDAKVLRFPAEIDNKKLRVPHMGWDLARPAKESKLFEQMPDDSRFYFVHSYYIRSNDDSDVLAVSKYGLPFHSALEKNNIVGVQFHPEKSHKFGKNIYRNFLDQY